MGSTARMANAAAATTGSVADGRCSTVARRARASMIPERVAERGAPMTAR